MVGSLIPGTLRSRATKVPIVNAHSTGVPADAARRCAEQGGRAVIVR